jgi:hypothetical protein
MARFSGGGGGGGIEHKMCFDFLYRVSLKPFPDYKHLLQEKYVEHKYSNCNNKHMI